jgi:pimeloyl-ACP methyl ester carboxylesterase
MMTSRRARAVAAGLATAVLPLGLVLAGPGGRLATASAVPTRSAVDSVPTPKINWWACDPDFQCGTVRLPLDYDKPNGAKVELGLIKTPARKPKEKIGTLFVNPGGPGGSAAALAAGAEFFFQRSVLDRFDVVGIDPRGVNFSQQVKCFPDARRQQQVFDKMQEIFPVTKKQVMEFSSGAEDLGRACSNHGKPLSGAMSTAEDARDMDVIRRAVGDKKLTYLGFSYGTYLGQVYADMFGGRVRSMVIDGVLDPVAWAGTPGTRNTPQTLRVPSAQGGYRALSELLRRCDAVGRKKCSFASRDSIKKFGILAARVRSHPVTVHDPDLGDFRIDYASMISDILSELYVPAYLKDIIDELTLLWNGSQTGSANAADLSRTLRMTMRQGYDFPYDNEFEAFNSVLCTDSVNPAKVSDWPRAIAKLPASRKYFGELWAWDSAPCASSTWTVRDEDAYRGPFNRRTSGPVLVVGNYWDPATNYKSAEKVARMLPNSRLLLSDSWGHTAYGTSACVTDAISTALVSVRLPARGTRCVGDVQPYGGALEPRLRTEQQTGIDTRKVDAQLRSHPGQF